MPSDAASDRALAAALLERHGRTFGEELGIDVEQGTPAPLFRLLCAALLMSARIGHGLALDAARALAEEGWRTPAAMADSTWERRAQVLNASGYARYDERTAAMLGDVVERLNDQYGGDLRRLRDAAERDPAAERRLLTELRGIGDVGADIFFREAQAAWDELRPFADRRALETARRLGLPRDADGLAGLVSRADFPRLVAALVRTGLEHDEDAVRAAAAA